MNNIMRQTLSSYEGLSLHLDWALGIDDDIALANGREDTQLTLENSNWINISRTLNFYAMPSVEAISYAYTRGDDIAEIENTLMSPSIPRILQTCEEFDALGVNGKEFFWGAAAGSVGEPYKYYMNPNDILNVMVLICHCMHLGVNDKDIRKFTPYIAPPGKSKIVDAVLSNFDGNRKVGDSTDYQQTFVDDALYEIYQAPMDDKPLKIKAYLKNWLKLLSKQLDGTAMNTLGHFMSIKHKTPKTLIKDTEGKYPLYRGHWAWEIALLVKLQGIDDSSFRDSQWYPVDIADYKK